MSKKYKDWILTETGDMSSYSPEQLCVIFSIILQNHKDHLKFQKLRGVNKEKIMMLKLNFLENIDNIVEDISDKLESKGSKYLS